jgi:23S rRNA (uracil1939-C5)-methyltransferase
MKTNQKWRQGELLEIEIIDISNNGDGVGRFEERVVFVPDTVPGDRLLARLHRVKTNFANGKLQQLLTPSPHRIRPQCIVADKCGGCQWQHIDYDYQLTAKQQILSQVLQRIGEFNAPKVLPVIPSQPLGHRNKTSYPLKRSETGQVQAGYYRKGTHQLINLNKCPAQDVQLDTFLTEIKQDIQEQGWSIYNEQEQRGRLRHLCLRIGRGTGEVLLTLVSTDWNLTNLHLQAEKWLSRYPQLVGVSLNHNPHLGNTIFGEQTRCVAGMPYLREKFAGLELQLRPDTFFQVNTEVAQVLLNSIIAHLDLQGGEVLVDAYCGIGTFTLPLAKLVKKAIGIELQQASVEYAQINAAINRIANVVFKQGRVENLLASLEVAPDIILLDPPRRGCDRTVIDTLLEIKPRRIVYISCQPATLARDLRRLCETNSYQLIRVQPADFFPQTPHVECAAFLERL